MHQYSSSTPSALGIMVVLLVFKGSVTVTATSDKECSQSAIGLVACMTYVTGTAKSPTPDCCAALKEVVRTAARCLCLLIKDRNDLDLGVKINTTLALSLPHVCTTSANITQCPALLGLYPNSPEAQIFYQYGKNSTSIFGPTAAPTPTPHTAAVNPVNAPVGRGTSPEIDDGSRVSYGKPFHIAITLFYFCIFT